MVELPLLNLVRQAVSSQGSTVGSLASKPLVDKLVYSVKNSDLGTAFRIFDGSSAVYKASIRHSGNGQDFVSGTIRIRLVDGYDFDFIDARRSSYCFHARLLGLSGLAKPFTSTIDIDIPFAFTLLAASRIL